MFRILITTILTLLTVAAPLRAATIEELRESAKAKDQETLVQWRTYLDSTQGKTDAANIEEMARLLRRLADQSKFQNQRDDADRMFREVQSSVLSYPDHAEHFRRKLDAQRQLVLDGKMAWSNYHGNSEMAFQTYAQLPSEATMQVLGDMLADSKGNSAKDAFPTQARESFQAYGSNAHRAARALRQIGLKDSPDFGGRIDDWDLIPIWKTWWDEVKAGTRTYHFKGTGTSETQARRPVTPTARPESGGTERSSDAPATSPKPSRSGLLWLYVVLAAAIAGGIALLISRKHSG
jgi:hypothetical protein